MHHNNTSFFCGPWFSHLWSLTTASNFSFLYLLESLYSRWLRTHIMAEASTNNEPSTPPTMRNVRQSAKGPATDDETETGGGSDDSGTSLSIVFSPFVQ